VGKAYRITDMFREIEIDHHGCLHLSSFISFVRRVLPTLTDVHLRRIGEHVSISRGGTISSKEIVSALNRAQKHPPHNKRKTLTKHLQLFARTLGTTMLSKLSMWHVDNSGLVNHNQLLELLRNELPQFNNDLLHAIKKELIEILDFRERIAVHDIYMILRAILHYEVDVKADVVTYLKMRNDA